MSRLPPASPGTALWIGTMAGQADAAELVIEWRWQERPIRLGMTRMGEGPTILLLPALSSISTRREMRKLQALLARRFATIALDWPGFGDLPRPAIAWEPAAYRAYLAHLLQAIVPHPFATIAAGHGAAYLLEEEVRAPGSAGRLCLIAPSWRGPLPTMAGRRHPVFTALARAVDLPVLGTLLYRLNVNPPVIRMMGRGHVYDDRAWLNRARLREKAALTGAPGARHAAFRFVTGELDPMHDRAGFLSVAAKVTAPTLILYGASTPPKTRAEIEALAKLPNMGALCLPAGKLALHEEYPDEVADAISSFLETAHG